MTCRRFDDQLSDIDIAIKLAFPRNTKYFQGFSKKELRRLLEICTQESHFQFESEFYEQIDGVSMGSPLGPLFANLFMCDFEKKHLSKLKNMEVSTWLRYVDDIFASFRSKEQAEQVLSCTHAWSEKRLSTIQRCIGNQCSLASTWTGPDWPLEMSIQ